MREIYPEQSTLDSRFGYFLEEYPLDDIEKRRSIAAGIATLRETDMPSVHHGWNSLMTRWRDSKDELRRIFCHIGSVIRGVEEKNEDRYPSWEEAKVAILNQSGEDGNRLMIGNIDERALRFSFSRVKNKNSNELVVAQGFISLDSVYRIDADNGALIDIPREGSQEEAMVFELITPLAGDELEYKSGSKVFLPEIVFTNTDSRDVSIEKYSYIRNSA